MRFGIPHIGILEQTSEVANSLSQDLLCISQPLLFTVKRQVHLLQSGMLKGYLSQLSDVFLHQLYVLMNRHTRLHLKCKLNSLFEQLKVNSVIS
jgi:hypothetical protein